MNDMTKEQKFKYITEALTLEGFARAGELEIFTYNLDNQKVVVDLTAGKSVYFKKGKDKITRDDEAKTLNRIYNVVLDAEDGKMPTKTQADINIKNNEIIPPEPTQTPETVEPETVEPESEPQEPPVINVDKPEVVEPTPAPNVPQTAPVLPPQPGSSLLNLIYSYVGNDVLQVFGDTGSGKSKFCLEAARQAIANGKKVYYLDTERNLTDADVASLVGCQYKYTPVLDEIDQIVQHLPTVDVVILDSIGFPVLTTYARLSVKQKGDALLKLIAIFGDLKTWAYKNNGIAIVTNQPESEFNKEKGHIFRPFGDKSQFAAKEIWRTDIEIRNQTQTKILISAFRSRSKGHGSKIATMVITDKGVVVAT